MGHKVNPIGFRLGVYRYWDARWYADKDYTKLLHEDIAMRRLILSRLRNAGVARIETERSANQLTIVIQTAKPGIVIGKQGASVDALRDELERISGKKVRITIHEIKTPDLDAKLVAENVASQLEKRIAFRRALKQTVMRCMRAGAKGVRLQVSGRLGGAEMSRREWDRDGRVPLHTLRANVDFGRAEAKTTFGNIGVQCWLYKGDFVTATGEPIIAGLPRAAEDGEDRTEVVAAAATRRQPVAPAVEAVAASPEDLVAQPEDGGELVSAGATTVVEAPEEISEEETEPVEESFVEGEDEIEAVVGPVAETGEKIEKLAPKRAPVKRKAPVVHKPPAAPARRGTRKPPVAKQPEPAEAAGDEDEEE